MIYLAVALGGALGALCRYLLSNWVQGFAVGGFPWGTLSVNVPGAFLLGLVVQLCASRLPCPAELRLFITTGFCGGLTTFSTFSHETLLLLEARHWLAAGGNILLNVLVCLGAAGLGLAAARLI